MFKGGALSVEKRIGLSEVNWQAIALKNLEEKLKTPTGAWQTTLLKNYYPAPALELKLKLNSTQHNLYLATVVLDQKLCTRLRQLPRAEHLAFYECTIKPFNQEFIAVMSQLQHKELLFGDKKLSPAESDRYLQRIKNFSKKINALPNIHEDYEIWRALKHFIQGLKALVITPKKVCFFHAHDLDEAIDHWIVANKQFAEAPHVSKQNK